MRIKPLKDPTLINILNNFKYAPIYAAGIFYKDELQTYYGTTKQETENLHSNEKILFDVASLTKALATAPMILHSFYANQLDFEITPFLKYVCKKNKNFFKYINIFNLLNHSSGLVGYKEFFKTCLTPQDIYYAIGCENPSYKPETGFVYSDLGYMILGFLLDELYGNWHKEYLSFLSQSINIKDKIIFSPLNSNIFYAPNNEPNNKHCCLVHDEHAQILSKSSAHSGLFATLEGVFEIINLYLKIYHMELSTSIFPHINAVKSMFSKPLEYTEFSYGWNTPSQNGYTSAGKFSLKNNVFGHLGFTGCSVWMHLPSRSGAIFLSNRVNLGRYENLNHIKQFRFEFYNKVYDFFVKAGIF